jgi:hypothetical protein
MVQILDLMIEARRGPEPYDPGPLADIAERLGDLADREFLSDIYDLMKQLSNRQTGA